MKTFEDNSSGSLISDHIRSVIRDIDFVFREYKDIVIKTTSPSNRAINPCSEDAAYNLASVYRHHYNHESSHCTKSKFYEYTFELQVRFNAANA